MFNKQTFYSNGKLLLTAEYLVLDGAIALALPTKFGQNLIVESGKSNQIVWKSYDADKTLWFEEVITFEEIKNKVTYEIQTIKNTLIEILFQANLKNPELLKNSLGFEVTTHLTFPRNWGLGTSSTLINNIAQWFEINAFELLKNSFGGSGYDIACAQNDSAILYQIVKEKPIVKPILFHPEFTKNIYFVYLNQKQNSRDAIANYHNKRGNIAQSIAKINDLTNEISTTNDISVFAESIQKHEIEISTILEMQTIQETLFRDFSGVIKSLGAWGGDFVMAISKENPTDYFNKKGFETILNYNEMIL